jgi:hypothetical protein
MHVRKGQLTQHVIYTYITVYHLHDSSGEYLCVSLLISSQKDNLIVQICIRSFSFIVKKCAKEWKENLLDSMRKNPRNSLFRIITIGLRMT